MAAGEKARKRRLYLGVDVGHEDPCLAGGAKGGAIVRRERCLPPPGEGGPEEAVARIEEALENVVDKEGLEVNRTKAIGVAIPCVVDPDKGLVVVTPNMNLSGVAIGPQLEERFGVPVANDRDLGTPACSCRR